MQRGLRSDDPGRGDLRGPARPPRPAARRSARGAGAGPRSRRPLADVREELREIVDEERAGGPAAARRERPGRARHRDGGAPDPELQAMLRSIAAKRLDSLDRCRRTSARGSGAPGLRLPRRRTRGSASTSSSTRSAVDARPALAGPGRRGQGHEARGPRRATRDGPRPQRPAGAAARPGAVAGRDGRVPGPARRVLPGRRDARRRHRAAGGADGGDAVAPCGR